MMIPAEVISMSHKCLIPKLNDIPSLEWPGSALFLPLSTSYKGKQSQAKTLDLTFTSRARLPGSVSLLLLVTKEVHVCQNHHRRHYNRWKIKMK